MQRKSTFVAGRLPGVPGFTHSHVYTRVAAATEPTKQGDYVQPTPQSTFHSDRRVTVPGVLGAFHFELLPDRGEGSLPIWPPLYPLPPNSPNFEPGRKEDSEIQGYVQLGEETQRQADLGSLRTPFSYKPSWGPYSILDGV